MASKGTVVDSLYLSLGIDLDQFDKDYVSAQKSVADAAKKLGREQRVAKMRLEIDLSQFDEAESSAGKLSATMEHLSQMIDRQNKIIEIRKLAWTESSANMGQYAGATQYLEESLAKEEKALAKLEQQARAAAKSMETLNQQAINADSTAKLQKEMEQLAALSQKLKVSKLNMEIDLTGLDQAGQSIDSLDRKFQHLIAIIEQQKEIVVQAGTAYETAAAGNLAASGELEASYLREKKTLAELENQAQKTADQISYMQSKLKKEMDDIANLTKQKTMQQIRMDIAVAGYDDANKSIAGLTTKAQHLNQIIEQQRAIVNKTGDAYQTALKEDASATDELMEKHLKEQRTLVELEQQAKRTAATLKTVMAEAGIQVNANPVSKLETVTAKTMGFVKSQISSAMFQVAAMLSVTMAFNWMMDTNNKMEQWRTQLTVLLRDANLAKKAMSEMISFADRTPYQNQEVIGAGKQLIASGLTDYNKYLTLAGDWAASQGVAINETVRVLSRINAGEYGEALERARELGITMKDLWVQGMQFDKGGAFTGTTDQLMNAMERIIKDRFGGMMDELSKEWAGVWSNFQAEADKAAQGMGAGTFAMLKDYFVDLTKDMKEMNENGDFAKLGEALGVLAEGVIGLGKLSANLLIIGRDVVAGFLLIGLTADEVLARIANRAQQAKEIVTLGLDEANNRFNQRSKETEQYYQNRWNKILGVKDATDQLGDAAVSEAGKAAAAQRKVVDEVYKRQQAVLQQVAREQKAEQNKIDIAKAYQKNAVEIAQTEFNNASKWLDMIEDIETQRKQIQGDAYVPSDQYFDAKKKYAETMSALYKARIDQADAMGEYVFASEKLIAESQAIEALGGDSGVKRYEALKAAVQEYLDTLDKMRSMQIEVWSSSQKLSLTSIAATQGNLQGLQNDLTVLEQQEKVMNVERLRERWDVLQQMLQSERLGVQQRKEIYEQERKAFVEYQNGMSSAIQDAMSKIDSLQQKVMSSAGKAVDILKQYFQNEGSTMRNFQQIWDTVNETWRASNTHTLDQIGQMLSFQQKMKDLGTVQPIDNVNIRPDEVMAALNAEISGIPNQIRQLNEGLNQLVEQAAQAGQTAADHFFDPWMEYFSKIQNAMAGLGNVNMPNLSANISRMGGSTYAATAPQVTNNLTLTIPITAQINSETDIGSIADRVTGVIVRRIEPVLGGGKYAY